MLNKLFKYIAVLIIVVLIGFGICYYLYNEPLPQGESGPEADALAFRMLDALDSEKFNNSKIVAWSFRGDHTYSWDREKELVTVAWNSNVVHLDLITPQSSTALVNNEPVSSGEIQGLIEDAQKYFNNDSFWLIAPYKVFDNGTERFLVTLEDGSEALLVTYTKGGDTPGDSYLWILERSGMPKSFKMWVKIIPIGGLEASWDTWVTTENGALLPTSHSFGPFTLSMGAVKASN